ncbi:hypothetical protein [Amycolatopsis sp. DG1A-15b]|uniref:esterase/lipase family protein n=1 Tax=Amycolatopsis sp. DG1A-15b TaxID=3052846 RepID=UPI00255B5CCA|nr:hypothetical protein [Amycolatopsis sp. DG1A-15b]WIX91339.1 hypothetical protein QRY02_13160 [Amycolatopsis sp. DG1A-15b]
MAIHRRAECGRAAVDRAQPGRLGGRLDTAKALRNQFGDRIKTFVYDYSHWSSYWASDEHIAPCLAYYLGQVSAEYEMAGCDKKVIVVAHSMGGIATRCALADGAAAKPPLATVVPYIITLGTPSLGSPWGGTMFPPGEGVSAEGVRSREPSRRQWWRLPGQARKRTAAAEELR